MKISRRNFLKVLGSATMAGALKHFIFDLDEINGTLRGLFIDCRNGSSRHYLYDEYRLGHECISPLHRRAAEL